MAAAGRKGHLAVVDMKNMSLIKEMQVCPGVARLI
jgi:U3 small nucleolar RNA-associated protein 7